MVVVCVADDAAATAARSRKGGWIGTRLRLRSSSGRFQEADESEKGFGKPALRLEIDTLLVLLESSRATEARSWK